MSQPLVCPHCGNPALPVDPGYTITEVAVMLRVKVEHVERLAAKLRNELEPPQYRRLSDHPRLHRIWSARDIQRMQQEIFVKRVKRSLTPRPSPPPPSAIRSKASG